MTTTLHEMRTALSITSTVLALVLAACGGDTAERADPSGAVAAESDVPVNPVRDVYFGNLHVHTSYSFDGFTNGSVTDPDQAYRWAKGEAIPGGGDGSMLQIRRPLDWYAVSDHAEYLGMFPQMGDPDSPLSQLEIASRVTDDDAAVAMGAYTEVLAGMSAGEVFEGLDDPDLVRSIWSDVVATADAHNDPGTFTTFSAFEWTSNPGERNLHRVVLFEGSGQIPPAPFSIFDSDRPEDLWTWMDGVRSSGTPLLAVPHNGNASNGLMFPVEESYGGSALTQQYAQARMRNEPLYEISQIKGSSETHPLITPNDEFAGFELWDYTLAPGGRRPENHVGAYARDAFKRGLVLEAAGIDNPFKYGVIGDSDTHNSASSIEEDNYTGKFGFENDPDHRLNGTPGFAEADVRQIREFSSGGVAAVWAESNTREALFAAMRRRETYGTSGPRMRVRVFAGYEFDEGSMAADGWLERAYRDGVPMGGDLGASSGDAPTLLIQAMKEPDGANLDRIQIVKGWVEAGEAQERIYDVAWSGGRTPGPDGSLPPVGNTVDASTATYSNDIGAPEFSVVWTDPDFDASQHAFYYARVLQIPTPRWSTYDAVTLGIPPRSDLPVSIQERAWTSPIWYTPGG